jgi:hypothetical protein
MTFIVRGRGSEGNVEKKEETGKNKLRKVFSPPSPSPRHHPSPNFPEPGPIVFREEKM